MLLKVWRNIVFINGALKKIKNRKFLCYSAFDFLLVNLRCFKTNFMKMRIIAPLLSLFLCLSWSAYTQVENKLLPKDTASPVDVFGNSILRSPGITQPPDFPVRAMAEWEEIQAIAIPYDRSWPDGHLSTLRAIAQEASSEVEVLVICELITDQDDFTEQGIDLTNISFFPVDLDNVENVWIRDYGPHTLYANDVHEMALVDWKYEMPSPVIDTIASYALAEYFNLPLYLTTVAPTSLRLDGGNFLTDGLGTGFSTKRVLEENGNDEFFVDNTMDQFMGIEEYIKFDVLQFDEIHHIDMHMKVLDEETILIGEYPEGVSDWARIEQNIAELQENHVSYFGSPYDIVRIPMPPDQNGDYPEGQPSFSSDCSAFFRPCYNTYTNVLFVNKKILVPTYQQPEFDEQALSIWQNLMPGYEIVGIDCSEVIPDYGALHCIAKEIGSTDPLLIVHQKLKQSCNEQEHRFEARIQHRTGIDEALLYYKTSEESEFTAIEMEQLNESIWDAEIEAYPQGTTVQYYIQAIANSGKQINRPLPAPEAYWSFEVNCLLSSTENSTLMASEMKTVFPNPGKDKIWIPVESSSTQWIKLELKDISGRHLSTIYEGNNIVGRKNYALNASVLSGGTYLLFLQSENGVQIEKFIKY